MNEFLDRLRTRVVPAVITAAGIAIVAAGLLTYSSPVAAAPDASGLGFVTAPPSVGLLTLPPIAARSSSPSASTGSRLVTRVVVPALGIDLPVVKPPGGFPYRATSRCTSIRSPCPAGPARRTSTPTPGSACSCHSSPVPEEQRRVDDRDARPGLHERRHALRLPDRPGPPALPRHRHPLALPTKDGQLWLQTSEGPLASSPKMQVVAQLLSSGPADHATAHPKAHPVVCG